MRHLDVDTTLLIDSTSDFLVLSDGDKRSLSNFYYRLETRIQLLRSMKCQERQAQFKCTEAVLASHILAAVLLLHKHPRHWAECIQLIPIWSSPIQLVGFESWCLYSATRNGYCPYSATSMSNSRATPSCPRLGQSVFSIDHHVTPSHHLNQTIQIWLQRICTMTKCWPDNSLFRRIIFSDRLGRIAGYVKYSGIDAYIWFPSALLLP